MFLPNLENSWPTKPCVSLKTNLTQSATINRINIIPENPLSILIKELLEHSGNFSKVLNAISLLLKNWWGSCQPGNHRPTWNAVRNSITSYIISCFKPEADSVITKNRLKHLVVHFQDNIHYVSDRSFRTCTGFPLICDKTILDCCIVQRTHTSNWATVETCSRCSRSSYLNSVSQVSERWLLR